MPPGRLGPILCGFLRYTVLFMNPWNTELGWQGVQSRYFYVSVGLVHILISCTVKSESTAFVHCGVQECDLLG